MSSEGDKEGWTDERRTKGGCVSSLTPLQERSYKWTAVWPQAEEDEHIFKNAAKDAHWFRGCVFVRDTLKSWGVAALCDWCICFAYFLNIQEMLHVTSFLFHHSRHRCCSLYEKKKTKYKKAIKAVSGFPTHFQRSKITKSATKRCVCALRVRVCAHAGLSRIVCAFCSRHSKALKAERRAFKAVIDFCLLGWPPSCPCARGCLATGLWFAFTWQGGQHSAQSVPPHGRRLLYRKTPLQLIPAKLFPVILSN